MARERRHYRDGDSGDEKKKRSKRDKGEGLQELVDEALSRLRTLDSQHELLKQKTNAMEKQILILKRAVLIEKKELLDLQKLEQQRRRALVQLEAEKDTEPMQEAEEEV